MDYCRNISNCKCSVSKYWLKVTKLKYRKIAERDDLMALIYDYFTNQIDSEELLGREYSDEEIKDIITECMWQL